VCFVNYVPQASHPKIGSATFNNGQPFGLTKGIPASSSTKYKVIAKETGNDGGGFICSPSTEAIINFQQTSFPVDYTAWNNYGGTTGPPYTGRCIVRTMGFDAIARPYPAAQGI
jgi:hypothetical protein